MNLNYQINNNRWNSRPIFSVRIGTSSWRNWLTGFGKRGGDRSVHLKLTGSQQSEPYTHRYRLQIRLLHSRPPRSTPQKRFTGNARLFVAAGRTCPVKRTCSGKKNRCGRRRCRSLQVVEFALRTIGVLLDLACTQSYLVLGERLDLLRRAFCLRQPRLACCSS